MIGNEVCMMNVEFSSLMLCSSLAVAISYVLCEAWHSIMCCVRLGTLMCCVRLGTLICAVLESGTLSYVM